MTRLASALRLLGRALSLALVLAVVGAGIGGVVLLHHPAAPAWVAGIAEEATDGRLTIARAEGRLAGPLRLEGVRWQGAGVDAGAAGVDLDWRPLDLLVGRLRIQRLHVEGLAVAVPEGAPEAEPATSAAPPALPQLPALPLTVDLSGVRISADALPGLRGPLHLRLGTRAGGTRLRDLALTARHAGARLDLRADGDWREYRLEAGLDLRGPTPLGPATGELRLRGDPQRLELEGRADGPARVRLNGELRSLLADPEVALGLKADRPGPALQEALGRPWLATLSARLSGPLRRPTVALRSRADLGPDGVWRLEAEGRRAGDGWLHLPTLTLSRLDGAGGAIAGQGVWHPEEARGAADLDSDGLALPRGVGRVDRLRASGGGTPDHWDLDLEAAATPSDYPSASARLDARGSAGTIRWRLFELAALGGTARGTGSLELAGGRPWQADLAWEDLESEALLPEWPATLSGETRLRGTLTEAPDGTPEGSRDTPEVIVDHLALAGDLRGHDLDLRGSGAWSPATWRLEGLEATLGENRLTARARGPQDLSAGVELRVPEPDLLHPDLRGRLEARLDWADGVGEGLVTATDLRWDDGVSIPRLRASVEGSPEHLRAALAVPAVTWEGRELGGLALNLAGPPREPQWTLAAGRPRLALAGTLTPLESRLTATTGTAHLGGALWELEGSLAAHLDGAAWGVESGCWLSDRGGRVCAGAQGSDAGGSAALELEGLELAPLARLLPGGTRLQSGVLGSRAHIDWSGTIDRLDLTARATDLALVHPRQEEAIAARLRSLDLTADYAEEEGLRARTTVRSAEPSGELTADVRLPRWRWAAVDPAQPLEGSVTADGVDLAWVGPLVPGFLRTEGRLEADVDLAGTLGDPFPRGRAEWREGRIRLAETGLDLRPVTATIIADGAGPLQLEARAGSDDGHLALAGTFQPRPPMTADLRLTGDAARVADLPEARVTVRPDIRLVVTPESASVEGEVRIPEARLVLPEGSGGGVSPSPDVVYRAEAPEPAGLPVTADIRLLLGPRVYLRGHGFRGRLEGDLRLIQEPGSPTRGRGELVIQDGHYRAWGQELTIDDGRLLFADTPVDNPGLDLRAERPGLSVTAGVHVGGRLQNPSLRLFSDPPMEDSEILSWVVLGRPLESASGEEGASLAAAATALQLAGGGRLANQLGDRFGIDEVGIASGTTADSAALVLGTWLSPRLYVRYAIGLTEDINTLRTRYLLDDQWTLEAETGAASGIDLLWSIDR